ncbi:L-histidine N(alpha)-methyltransferase [Sphingomonas parva]|uniref:L-histidine N(Alpha)-methyltransferase n=1 Tax=Sphingomonas parva TaxID=2555898 RepID=A0A4Y8ZM46_9SPHN|nr:L-histidine N(alpha)-methyltransferase [Sphingomonas parva]TFI57071.1 L-histidine N(alpha)-methyltransferase [Sphingomonas parva]
MTDVIADTLSAFGEAVLAGLSQPQKTVPARFFYDRRGSELFEAITKLPEYYPTRTEIALLRAHGPDIARLSGPHRAVIEFGSGSSRKTPLLLDAVKPPVYVPIDISGDYLHEAASTLADAYPDVDVLPVTADFTRPLTLPAGAQALPALGFFPGSTIGNLSHAAAVDLLRALAATLGAGACLVIGIDTRKNPRLLETAYDDDAGVTAAFNLNLLHRMNRELDGDVPVDAFEHRAVWHDGLGRIEMHLVATRDVTFRICGRSFSLAAGESIHTENSYKYTIEEARLLARASGWEPLAAWTDHERLFALHFWRAADARQEP